MNLTKILDFTKQLEYSLEKLSLIPDVSESKKEDLLKKIELLSSFNARFQHGTKIDSKGNHL